jgi:hypothetical protein
MTITDDRLAKVAEQMRALAADFGSVRDNRYEPLMTKLKGLLLMYFPDGKLDPRIHEAVSDAGELATLTHDSAWLSQRAMSLPGGDVPRVQERLAAVALSLERVVTKGQTTSAGAGDGMSQGPTAAQQLGAWLLLDGRLGHGGQGEVTLVRHARTLERGALKRMSGRRALTAKGQERFLREIEAFRRIQSPFVVSILDTGAEPEPYLVTEVATFGSLHDNVDAFRGDAWRCLRLARSVALGLEAAHVASIVHRDVKPKNILLASLDHPLVADFGIAHFSDKDAVTSVDSHPGAFKFAPPEYEFEEEPTPAFDVFSLGAVLHFAMTGAEQNRPYRAVSKLPAVGTSRLAAMDELIARMTMRDVKERIQGMSEIVSAVDALLMKLFGRTRLGPLACSCDAGDFKELGTVRLGPGTEINVYPDSTKQDGRGLMSLAPKLEMCVACGALRLRAKAP